MLESFLEDDYSVTTFSNPKVALNSIQNGDSFDLILCDIMMPEMNGLELLKQLNGGSKKHNVIMMTAYDTMDKALEAHQYGAKNYVKKPFKSLGYVQEQISKII